MVGGVEVGYAMTVSMQNSVVDVPGNEADEMFVVVASCIGVLESGQCVSYARTSVPG